MLDSLLPGGMVHSGDETPARGNWSTKSDLLIQQKVHVVTFWSTSSSNKNGNSALSWVQGGDV